VRDVALFLHILGALTFVSGLVLTGVGFEAARRREIPAEVALLLRFARLGVLLVGAGGLLVVACGFWLVGIESLGLDTGWLDAAIALLVLAVGLGAIGGSQPKRARLLAEELTRQGSPLGNELRSYLDDPRSRIANYASAVLVLGILALMVFKP
jgi:uncharacterized membrane protein